MAWRLLPRIGLSAAAMGGLLWGVQSIAPRPEHFVAQGVVLGCFIGFSLIAYALLLALVGVGTFREVADWLRTEFAKAGRRA